MRTGENYDGRWNDAVHGQSIWLDLEIDEKKREEAIKRCFDVEGEIANREEAINYLLTALDRLNNRLLPEAVPRGNLKRGSAGRDQAGWTGNGLEVLKLFRRVRDDSKRRY